MTPLAHRRILITRPPQQASELADRLRALGATPISIPTIEIAPPASFAVLDAALASLSSFDVVAFTSANAVTAFQQRARLLGIAPQPRRIAVVGPSTARAVEAVVTTFRQPALVEQFIDGRELNVALLGHPTPRVLPLSEIDFAALPAGVPRIVSYDAKWTTGSVDDLGTVPVMHPQLPSAVAARVRRAAAEAFRAVGVRDYGRVDVRLAVTGVPYVVDVNPNCDLSPHAGMARAAAAVGIDYDDLVGLLVRYALRRRRSVEGVAMEQRSRQQVPARSGATRRL